MLKSPMGSDQTNMDHIARRLKGLATISVKVTCYRNINKELPSLQGSLVGGLCSDMRNSV